MRHPLEEKTVESLHAVARGLVEQDGNGVPRRSLVDVAESADGYAFSIVRGEPTLVVAHRRPPAAFAELTPREREVAALIARGLRNAEIARELVISTATVKDHVHRILHKTGLSSRAAVAAAWE